MTDRLDRAIDRALQERRIVGTVVLVAEQGEVVYRRAAGWADREAARPMAEDAVFLWASLTKPLVAAATLRLVEQGRIGLQDPVTRWLPAFTPRMPDGSAPAITIHQLLTHSAGLDYAFIEAEGGPHHRLNVSAGLDQPGLGFQENMRRLAQAPLIYAPGAAWSYSMAYDVLGGVVAAATGQALPQAMEALVTQPCGMRDAGFAVRDRARLVAHYGDAQPQPTRMGAHALVPFPGMGARVPFAPERLFDPASYPSGGAGMAGTAGDLLAFLQNLLAGRLLRPATVALMAQPHVGPQAQTQGPGWGFGYGGAVLVDPAAAQSPQSAGTLQWGGAYGHSWFLDRARGLAVAELTNTAFEGMASAGRYPAEVRDAVYGP
ncbi:serine hydrolase domain-containing protein [Ramlibacter sp.]|uniref:serine hydrolase domain-containing protein n=1 Tax=Ramlibacter sp. TaxID=1917967 RepID=UPI0025F8BBD0|nr:serine hydrolase domain-containing protein [Ramlibacter sp.]